ncbi:MAG: IS1595 family transposase [Nitrospinae bacterium]|nr:IS1595 family transposase [Nitrospinota bacterium]
MKLLKIYIRYPDHESCIEHLESMRFGDEPFCLHCGGLKVARKADGNRIGRWNCHDCKASFNVLSGTIFQKTRIPLQKWFLAIGLLLSAEKNISSHQLARDLDLNQKTAWYMAMRIRKAMQSEGALLRGIVKADDGYIGGKSRKGDKRDDDKPGKRGRGTAKMPVTGTVKRGGSVVEKVTVNLESKGLIRFIKRAALA